MTASLVGSIPMRFRSSVVATVGHVDHGKTRLVHALTGVDTDRLPDEKRRGISIELGYAAMPQAQLPAGLAMSFVDVPGHEKLVGAMIAGLGGVDVVLLTVAANDGVMPQTKEHLWICRLLGVRCVVVSLSKADLVDEETLELAREEVLSELQELGLEVHAVIATSSESGQGIEELRQALVEAVQKLSPRAATERVWLAIDRSFAVKGVGTVVTGTLTRGVLSTGATVYVSHQGTLRPSSCRSLQVHGQSVEQVAAPSRVAINLGRLSLSEVERGEVVTSDPELCITRRLDAHVLRLPSCERQTRDRSPVYVYLGTARSTGRIHWLGDELAQLSLDQPLPAEGGLGLILRGFSKTQVGRVLGGGRVLDAGASKPPRRRDAERCALRVRLLNTARAEEHEALFRTLASYQEPRPLQEARVESRFGLEPGSVAQTLKNASVEPNPVRLKQTTLWTFESILESARMDVERQLRHHHSAHPDQHGPPLEVLRSGLAQRAGTDLANLVMDDLLKAGAIVNIDGCATLREAFERSEQATRELSEGLFKATLERGLTGATLPELSEQLSVETASVRRALGRLSAKGQLKRLGELWFAEPELERLRQAVRSYLQENERMSVPAFKEIAGVTRKQAIVLLEQLDRERTTRRVGDDRVLAGG